MPKGYPGTGKAGTKQPEGVPDGMRHHKWVAACNIPIRPHEVGYFLRKAQSTTRHGRDSTGNASISRAVEVLDVTCSRCGTRPGRDEFCPRYPMDAMGLPR